jgi:hypothetical protein
VTKQGDIASEEIDKMAYIVRHESEVSTMLCAFIGIIIGDTPSPILWTIYLSEFKLLSDAATDILFAGVHHEYGTSRRHNPNSSYCPWGATEDERAIEMVQCELYGHKSC